MSRRVFITGGTGFVGKALVSALRERGDHVTVLSRNKERATAVFGAGVDVVAGDPSLGGDWQAQVSGHDALINLAGQSIGGKRWNAQYRQILVDSRVETTRYLVEAIGSAESPPKVLVSASGIDYYPFDVEIDALGIADLEDEMEVTEQDRPGDSFLARLCRKWEKEALRAREHGVRVVCMRSGVVLGDDGPLAQIARPFKMLVGGRLSNGRQWFSWIHMDDAVAGYLFALDTNDLNGPVNLVAPTPVRNREFTRALASALRRPAIAPVPAFALRLAVGEFHEYLINGRRAIPAALSQAGFAFRYPEIAGALTAIYA